jgi:hypothetical protein
VRILVIASHAGLLTLPGVRRFSTQFGMVTRRGISRCQVITRLPEIEILVVRLIVPPTSFGRVPGEVVSESHRHIHAAVHARMPGRSSFGTRNFLLRASAVSMPFHQLAAIAALFLVAIGHRSGGLLD